MGHFCQGINGIIKIGYHRLMPLLFKNKFGRLFHPNLKKEIPPASCCNILLNKYTSQKLFTISM